MDLASIPSDHSEPSHFREDSDMLSSMKNRRMSVDLTGTVADTIEPFAAFGPSRDSLSLVCSTTKSSLSI